MLGRVGAGHAKLSTDVVNVRNVFRFHKRSLGEVLSQLYEILYKCCCVGVRDDRGNVENVDLGRNTDWHGLVRAYFGGGRTGKHNHSSNGVHRHIRVWTLQVSFCSVVNAWAFLFHGESLKTVCLNLLILLIDTRRCQVILCLLYISRYAEIFTNLNVLILDSIPCGAGTVRSIRYTATPYADTPDGSKWNGGA